MNGKSKCRILKQIRQEIAKRNEIEFVTSECKFQGECTGTCPKCEAEVRYLEQELSKRRQAGKAVVVAGIAAALVMSGSGCAPSQPQETRTTAEQTQTTTDTQVDGEMVIGELPSEETEALMGEPAVTVTESVEFMGVPEYSTEEELMGDMPLPEEQWTE